MTVLSNDHLLVAMLIDVCEAFKAPTLLEALHNPKQRQTFCSTERLHSCKDVNKKNYRVKQKVKIDIDFGKPIFVEYHTEHIVSSTGKMTLTSGYREGYTESIIGLVHDRPDRFEIQPIVMGAPWLDHPRNGKYEGLMWLGPNHGEILPEDIDQFSKMKDIEVGSTSEWMHVMKSKSEEYIKEAFASLLNEPTKKDWGGEQNDHFSGSVSIGGRRKTAAFLLKGPTLFREMTMDMCGARADQIHRLASSGADISIVQNAHMIGSAVRTTLRALIVHPGYPRKYCVIDGQDTYRILKAYDLI
jgi:hypothetical protein